MRWALAPCVWTFHPSTSAEKAATAPGSSLEMLDENCSPGEPESFPRASPSSCPLHLSVPSRALSCEVWNCRMHRETHRPLCLSSCLQVSDWPATEIQVRDICSPGTRADKGGQSCRPGLQRWPLSSWLFGSPWVSPVNSSESNLILLTWLQNLLPVC